MPATIGSVIREALRYAEALVARIDTGQDDGLTPGKAAKKKEDKASEPLKPQDWNGFDLPGAGVDGR